jgi:hypothetical protein
MNPETRPDHVPLQPLAHAGGVARFVLISRWRLRCTPHRAWKLLSDLEGWPVWWSVISQVQMHRDVVTVDPEPTTSLCWRRVFGRTVIIDQLNMRSERRPHDYFEIDYRLVDHFVTHGLWILDSVPTAPSTNAHEVDITYRCEVELNKTWMRIFAPVLRTWYGWHHLRMMRSCVGGMARQLKCESSQLMEWSIHKH